MYTLDTNILIYYLKNDPKSSRFLREKILAGSRFFISTISEAELFGYPEITREETLKINEILQTISIIPIDSQIARLAGYFKRTYNTELPDALVVATAFLTNSTLLTRNIKHFKKIKELKAKSI